MVYRANIKGSSDLITAQETLDYIDDWRRNEQTVLYSMFRLRMSQDCTLQISSFNEVECKKTDDKKDSNTNNLENSDGRHSKEGLLLGSDTCYRFQACDTDSDQSASSGDGTNYPLGV